MSFDAIITEPCIFICGENEVPSREVIDRLFVSKIEHLYFIKPAEKIAIYLQEVAESTVFYTLVNNVDEIDFGKHHLFICGFKPISELSRKLKKNYHSVTIFFNQELGIFSSIWNNIPNIKIYEQSLTDYTLEHFEGKKEIAAKLKDGDDLFFVNRGEPLDEHRLFVNDQNKRCCKIIGMHGIGKQAFIKKLKFSQGIGENCFEFSFVDKDDDVTYLLTGLLRKFGIPASSKAIDNTRLLSPKIPLVLEKIFNAFDEQDNTRIIFYNFEKVYNYNKKKFYDRSIELFFHHLLNRVTYKQNKVYIVASENFEFPAYADRDLASTILLRPMHPTQIQLILEHEFNKKGKNELAVAIMKYDFKIIEPLFGGHPQIGKLFVEACEKYPMDSIINDEDFRKKFNKEKVAYLMQHIQLSDQEKEVLFFISLFQTKFEIDAIAEKHPKPQAIIESLWNKLLLDKDDFADGRSKYHVPLLVKDYAISQQDEGVLLHNYNIIAHYYWNYAENLKAAPAGVLEAYRLALHYFSLAKNTKKEKYMIMYFKGIFLKKARECFYNREHEIAWRFYDELYQQTDLNEEDLYFYLSCSSKLREKLKLNKIIQDLFENALVKYPKSARIRGAYAYHFFYKGEYEKAKTQCLEGLEIDTSSISLNFLYPRVLDKLETKEKAISWIIEKIKAFRADNSEKGRRILFNMYVCYYSMLSYYSELNELYVITPQLVKDDNAFCPDLAALTPQIKHDNIEEILSYFEEAKNNFSKNKNLYIYPAVYRNIFSAYAKFLVEIKNDEKAQKILDEGKDKGEVASEASLEAIFKGREDFDKNELVEVDAKTEKNIKSFLERKIATCEKCMTKSREMLQNALTIKPKDYEALFAMATLLTSFKKLKIVKKIVELSYNEQEKIEFLKGLSMKKVFISYNHKDVAFAEKIKNELEKSNIQVSIDVETLKFGDDIKKFIEHSVRESDFVISIVSKNSLKSAWVIMESLEALMYEKIEQKKVLVPLYIDRDLFDDEFYLEADASIQKDIDKLNDLMDKAFRRNIDTSNYSAKRERLLDLKNNLGKILKRLNETLTADFSADDKIKENLPKLIDVISK